MTDPGTIPLSFSNLCNTIAAQKHSFQAYIRIMRSGGSESGSDGHERPLPTASIPLLPFWRLANLIRSRFLLDSFMFHTDSSGVRNALKRSHVEGIYDIPSRRSKGGAGGAARPGPQVDGGPARGPRAYLKL